VWEQLVEQCRPVVLARAELRVSGRVNGEGIPSLTTGVAVDAHRLAIVALVGVQRVFNLAGTADAVVLLNHLEARVTRGSAAEVVEALVGVHLPPLRLLALLSGCVSADTAVTGSDRIGDIVRLRTSDSTIYLRERNGQWRLHAAEFDDITADYRSLANGWPREIEVRRAPEVALRLRVIEFERNPQLPAAAFVLPVPDAYIDMPLDTLRREGPLSRRD